MILVIIGLAGAIGSGKSFTQLKQALDYAEERQKQLVFNFEININELYKYASAPKQYNSFIGYFTFEFTKLLFILLQCFGFKVKIPATKPRLPWVCRLCRDGGIIQIPAPKYLEALLVPESVVCLDEAGILLNSREFAKTSKELLADLAQSRKDGCDLFWAAQFDEQVDRQLRLLTQYWIHCDSLSVYDKKMRRPRLFWKRVYWFRASDYMHWQSNVKDRGSHLKARFAYGFKYEGGLLTSSDKQIFNIFDSFSRLDRVRPGSRIVSMHLCKLPRDYYFKHLLVYDPALDPLSKKYQLVYGWFRRTLPLPAAPTELVVQRDRSSLIRSALSMAKSKGVSAPYLKSMSDAEIKNYLKCLSNGKLA